MHSHLPASLLRCTLRFVPAVLAVGGAFADVGSDIRQSLRVAALNDTVSLSVVDVATGAVYAAERESLGRKPASNMKLLTTGAALAAFGPEFKFQTRLLHNATGDSSRLILVGSGDPGLGDPELLARLPFTDAAGVVHSGLTSSDLMNWWSDKVRAAGIARVSEIVIDSRIFDRESYNPSWPSDQRTRPYCAEVWGLNFHTNMMVIGARAADGGKVVLDRFEPQYDWILARNVASVGSSKSKQTFVVTRSATDNALTASGKIRPGAQVEVDLAVHDTPTLFGELLARNLRAHGIEVGTTRVAAANDPEAMGTVLGVIETPLAAVLARANTDSNNLHAEALFKRLGAFTANPRDAVVNASFLSGSWENGRAALARSIQQRIGADGTPFVIADGCGLSHDNRVTAAGMTSWLCSFARDPVLRAPFLDSLALAGESGTVRKRFAKLAGGSVSVRCKTGSINGVSCLSGVAIAADGRMIAFSVLVNQTEKVGGATRPHALQEAVVMDIVRELSGPRAAGAQVLAPQSEPPTR